MFVVVSNDHAAADDKPNLPARRAILLGLILLAAFGLRAADAWYRVDIPGIRAAPDEGYSLILARSSWNELIRQTAADTHPPFYYMLLKAWFILVPDTQFMARLLSTLFSMGALAYLFAFTRRLFGERAAWIALVCAAVAPYQVYWGHLARMHALQPLFILMILHHTVGWLSDRRPRDRVLCTVGWILAIQTNYMALTFGLVWGLAVLVWTDAPWRHRLTILPTGLVGLLTMIPWLAVLAQQMDEGPANRGFFQQTVSPIYFYYHSLFGSMEPWAGPGSGVFFYVTLTLFTGVFAAGIKPLGRRWSLWILLLLSPTIPIITAKLSGYTLAERHLLYCLPVFMAYWGMAVTEVVEKGRGFVRNRSQSSIVDHQEGG